MTNHIMTLGIMSPKASCSQVQVSCVLKGSFVNYAFSDGVIVAHSQEFHLLRFVWMCIYTFCTKVQAFSQWKEIRGRVYENTTGYLKNHWTKHIVCTHFDDAFDTWSMLISNMLTELNNSEFSWNFLTTKTMALHMTVA